MSCEHTEIHYRAFDRHVRERCIRCGYTVQTLKTESPWWMAQKAAEVRAKNGEGTKQRAKGGWRSRKIGP